MTRHLRVLLVGTGSDELEGLREVAADIVAPGAELLALDVPRGSTDPGLAWGTEQVQLRQVCSAHEGGLGPPAAQPLAEDGDVWKAILAAADGHEIDVIVIASLQESWLRRIFVGSTAHDLLDHAALPVLAVPDGVAAASNREPAGHG